MLGKIKKFNNYGILPGSHLSDIVNHPVHIMDNRGNFSPTAFIPFCSFGGNMEAVGTLTDIFPLPVCTSFRKRFLEGRLCYEFDPRHLKVDVDRATAQKVGLSLLVDVNAEYDLKKLFSEPEEKIFQDINDEFFRLENSEEIEIQIDTISKCLDILFSI